MALPKIRNPRTLLVVQFVGFVVVMFLVELLISDGSVASALVTSLLSGLVFIALWWWLDRRSRRPEA